MEKPILSSKNAIASHVMYLTVSAIISPVHSMPFARILDILAEPADTLAVALPKDDRAHEHLDRSNAFQRYFAFARSLVEAKDVA
jgi:hypothetical protein